MTEWMTAFGIAAGNLFGALVLPLLTLAEALHWEDAFRAVFNLGVNGAWATVLVLALRAVLRLAGAPKKYAYVLWAVAAFRFACPFSFTVDAVFSLLPSAGRQAIPADIGMQAVPQIHTGSAAVDRVVNGVLPAPVTAATSVNPMQLVMFGCGVIWGVGVLVFAARAAWSAWRLHRQMAAAVPLCADRLAACNALPTGRSPLRRMAGEAAVVTLPGAENAFVYGVLRPRICLPQPLGDTACRCVLLHERIHIARGDQLWKLLAFCLLCVHWFNPFAWLAFWLMERDMEMSCDEAALACLGGADGSADYAQSLLDLAAKRRLGALNPVSFGESDAAARIKHALRYKKPAVWVSVISLVLVAVVGFGLAADPEQHEAAPPAPSADGSEAVSVLDASDPQVAAAQQVIGEVSARVEEYSRICSMGEFDGAGAPQATMPPDATVWPPVIEIDGHGGYYRVYDSRYKTLEDIEALLQRTYSRRRAEQLREYLLVSIDGSSPGLFAMHEGALYRASADGPLERLSDRIVEIEAFGAEELRVVVLEHWDGSGSDALMRYRLVHEDGAWKMDYTEYLDG